MMAAANLTHGFAIFLLVVIVLILMVNMRDQFLKNKNNDDDYTHWL